MLSNVAAPSHDAAVLIGLYLVYGIYLKRSRWLREVLMFGGNSVAARYAGVRVSRRIVETYVLTGGLAFIAALIFTSRNGAISASSLEGFELEVIVAVVLGGTRVDGGVARFAGTFLGVLVIAVMEEGLRITKLWGDRELPFEISHLRYLILGVLRELFRTGDRDDWVAKLREADCVAAPINTLLEASNDVDNVANGHLAEIEYPQLGETLKVHGTPWRFSETPPTFGRAPKLGQHNGEILGDLGYSDAEIADFASRNII